MATYIPKQLFSVETLTSSQQACYCVGNLLSQYEMDPINSSIVSGTFHNTVPGVWNTATNFGSLTISTITYGSWSASATTGNFSFSRATSSAASSTVRSRTGTDGMPVTAGETYWAEIWIATDVASNRTLSLRVVWFDGSGVELSTTIVQSRTVSGAGNWFGYSGNAVAPANSAFACLEIAYDGATAASETVFWGGATFFKETSNTYVIVKSFFTSISSGAINLWPLGGRKVALSSNTANVSRSRNSYGGNPRILGAAANNSLITGSLILNHGDLLIASGGTSSVSAHGIEVVP